MAMCVCAAVLRCHTRNLLLCGLFGGADLAMCIFGAGLWCQVRNLLCGLFEGGPIWPCVFVPPYFGATCATSFSVGYLGGPTWQCVSLVLDFGAKCATSSVGYLRGGAYLAMHVCATVLWCHTRNLLLCGIFGGPIWPCVSVVPDFSAMHATSFSMGYLGGRFGHACLCHQTSVPHMQPLSLFAT